MSSRAAQQSADPERQRDGLSPSLGALYTREWRRREKSGRILLRIEIDEAGLVSMLVGLKLLDPLEPTIAKH